MNIAIVDRDPKRVEWCKAAIASVKGCYNCWTASDAAEAITKASINTPNLILMNISIALETVEKIMSKNPCTILVMTNSVSASSSEVFKVMGQGALDVVKLQDFDERFSIDNLHNKILMIQLLLGTEHKSKRKRHVQSHKSLDKQLPPFVVVGASTGGPAALAELLNSLPDECPYAFVVVQHVDPTFAPGLADWLQKETDLPVVVAKPGSRPQIGKVLLAAAEDHLVMNKHRQLYYTPYPVEKPYKPSIDVFFESVANYWPETAIAILLTGMGSDGAIGLKRLADLGWHTMVQHEDSCVVYGMPKAAIGLGAAKEVLTVEEIGKSIEREVRNHAENNT